MSLTCCFDIHHLHLHIAATGAPTLTEWQECLARLTEETASPPRAPILLDFTSTAQPARDWELPLLAFLLRRLVEHRRCRLAIHSATSEHGLSLAMLAFTCDATHSVEAFHSLDLARAWLKQPHTA